MSNPQTSALQAAAKNIDAISKSAMEAFASPESFEKELSVATAVQQLRTALTPAVMSEVMALMNTSIGFDTDRNPNKTPKDKDGSPMTPYSVEVVRDVFIESRLRGFHVVGKEFSIIAGNFYGGVNGLERLTRTHKKVSNFRDTYDVPRALGDKGALVKCKAEWLQADDNGGKQQQTLEREFAIRVNAGQGADAILGKAKRKLMAAVLSRLTGAIVPEGDTDDVPMAPAKVEAAAPSALFQKPTATIPPAMPDEPPMEGKTPLATAQEEAKTPRDKYARLLTQAGVSFEDFRSFIATKNLAKSTDSWAFIDDIPTAVFTALDNAPKTMAELIKKFGTQAAK
ncbi:MAG: hypothetical protein WCH99_04155 [Verrucomicrobiota bacterium]